MNRHPIRALILLAASALALPAAAQFSGVTLPPNGDNQKSSVTQHIGLVKVTIDYSSPDVHAPNGADRTGKIWGELVPYGIANLGFGTCGDQCPWRGGANENTVFTTTHDVKIQGQALPAGSYGLHFLPGPDEWTVIFSKTTTSWGSFFYDAKEDVLRVKAKPAKSEYHEWLSYEFTDRKPDKATVALKWENLQVPFDVAVPNAVDLWVQNMRNELRSSPGFTWNGWNAAAQYALTNKTNLEEALRWAEQAAKPPTGQENVVTLSTLAQLQEANGKVEESKKTFDRALNHPTAGPLEIHAYGRQLQAEKKYDDALRIFELNAKRHPNQWPIKVGLARGHAALGHKAEALKHAREGLAQAPDEASRTNLENLIKQIEAGTAY
jgi:tetratricopeptide (TPR) repeat protein